MEWGKEKGEGEEKGEGGGPSGCSIDNRSCFLEDDTCESLALGGQLRMRMRLFLPPRLPPPHHSSTSFLRSLASNG